MDAEALEKMKRGVMLINTGRGALIDSRALIDALKSGHIGAAGLDVYEEEEGIFFQDLSGNGAPGRRAGAAAHLPERAHHLAPGLPHRARPWATSRETTLASVQAFERGEPLVNEVKAEQVLRAPAR